MKVYTYLDGAPEWARDTAALIRWAENYDHPSPFTLFLDIIGWSDDAMGGPGFDLRLVPERIGYLECGQLADALREYADRPVDVRDWIDGLFALDGDA